MDVNRYCFGELQENLDGGNCMKKLVFMCCLLLIISSLMSCQYDPYSDQRPFDYGEARWSSIEPNVYFVIDMNANEYYYPLGKITIDNYEYICKFWFIHQTNQLTISVYTGETISSDIFGEIAGTCIFSPDSLVLQIESDTVFSGQYDKITFYKE